LGQFFNYQRSFSFWGYFFQVLTLKKNGLGYIFHKTHLVTLIGSLPTQPQFEYLLMADGHLGGECKDWLEWVSATDKLSCTMPATLRRGWVYGLKPLFCFQFHN
jgi:hypothetical protein